MNIHAVVASSAISTLFAALALTGSANASTPVPPAVRSAIDTVQAKPEYQHTNFGLMVKDRETGEVLLAQNEEKLFTPGSIQKVFTSAAALDAYGPDYRFRTPVYRRGKVVKGKLRGNLVLVASGDFAFGLRDRPDGTMGYNSTPEIDHNYGDVGLPGPTILKGSNPLRGVNRLARQIKRSGIRRVKGNVVVDDRLFRTYDGWSDGKMSPIWLNENVIDAEAHPTAIGKRAKVQWRPKTSMYQVINRTRTGAAGSNSTISIAGPRRGKIVLSGRIPLGSDPILRIVHVPNPAALARTALIDALRRKGVKVSAPTVARNPRPLLPGKTVMKSGRRVGQYVSDPLSEFVKVIDKVSFNRGADLLACMLAVKRGSRDCETGVLSIVGNNSRLGISTSLAYPFDGAGSDNMARISPTAAILLLENAIGKPYGLDLRDALPILGVDGTLRETGLESPAKGMVRTKTGNRVGGITDDQVIAGAQTRIGYMETKGGRQLVYADLLGNIPMNTTFNIGQVDADMTLIETAIQQGY